ncbi:NADase-type glycan-binding domain-containing protein [Aestuariimicrobium kwangyangense]|uniref:NADase-type glycan-binding domain-containing protein n=1 Tax=Aestuariimicrobium kwangyangense TaxID=396389 RepID=UPI0003B73DFC|nr:hypothetical protein [Aestuariimicrobium kwangyangense]
MPDEMPDDWFRPRTSPDRTPSDDAPPRGAGGGAGRPATPQQHPEPGLGGQPADGPHDGAATAEFDFTQERYTTQFKPGYAPRSQPSGRAEVVPPAPEPTAPAIPPTPAPTWSSGATASQHDTGAQTRVGGAHPPRTSFIGRHPGWVTLLAVVLALAVGLSAGQLIRGDEQRDPASPGVSGSSGGSRPGTPSTSASPVVAPWAGPTAPLKADTVSASCTAPDATDADGRRVTYPAAAVLDDNPDTAWRCNGDGLGQSLTFTFPNGSVLVGVGLQNGYVKTAGKDQLYDQYRKVTRVRWTMADGSWFVQSLSDNNPSVQQVLIPPTTLTGRVTLTIEASTRPGRVGEATRDAVLLSSVSFQTKV